MKAKIDIKLPCGKSPEGFPVEVNCSVTSQTLMDILNDAWLVTGVDVSNPTVHVADTITIELRP